MRTIAFLSIVVTILVVGQAAKAQNETNQPEQACPWPENLDAVKAAPENHKVIFENEHVRVLDVSIAPHSKEPIHAHCWPATLYIQQAGDVIDRDANGKILFDSRQLKVKPKAPFVEWTPQDPPHSIENLDDLPLKLIRVENKPATNRPQEICPWPGHLDGVKAAPAGVYLKACVDRQPDDALLDEIGGGAFRILQQLIERSTIKLFT